MPSPINKQPVFTTTPILVTQINDPDIVVQVVNPTNYFNSHVFESSDSYGTLIERITLSSTADINSPNVSAKLIYFYLYDVNQNSWSLYDTVAVPATTVSTTVPNAKIEWVFTGGLLLPPSFKIYIGASTNANNSGFSGDRLSVTVEGSTYTQV